MPFIAENPLIMPKINHAPSTPSGTRGIFVGEDGLYIVDENNNIDKLICLSDMKIPEKAITGLKYYGDASIEPSDSSLFAFTVDAITMTATVKTASTNISGDIVIPYKYEINNETYTVTSIGDYAFEERSSLTSIIIPNSMTSIGDAAFYGCSGLTSIIIPDSVTSIGSNAFRDCNHLTSITIPDGVMNIETFAFCGCSGLTNITIPDGVTSIGDSAFFDCSSLTSITIPDSVTSIESFAFNNCNSLKDVYYKGTKEQWNSISTSENNDLLLNATIHYEHVPTTKGYVDEEISKIQISGGSEIIDLGELTNDENYYAAYGDLNLYFAEYIPHKDNVIYKYSISESTKTCGYLIEFQSIDGDYEIISQFLLNGKTNAVMFRSQRYDYEADAYYWEDFRKILDKFDIDQSYNSKSENAQSGKAVAQAVDKLTNSETLTIGLEDEVPDDAVGSICDFNLIPKTVPAATNILGDKRKFFYEDNVFYKKEIPLITTRGTLQVQDNLDNVLYKKEISEFINYDGYSDSVTNDRITKVWSNRFYISKDFEDIEDVGDSNSNKYLTLTFTPQEFEKHGLPLKSNYIPIVSPYFISTPEDSFNSISLVDSDTLTAFFSYDLENDLYIFKCRGNRKSSIKDLSDFIRNHTNGYFCYPLENPQESINGLITLGLKKGCKVTFKQDDNFDYFWEYAKTQKYCPFFKLNDQKTALVRISNKKGNDNDTDGDGYKDGYNDSDIDTNPNCTILIPQGAIISLDSMAKIAKELNFVDEKINASMKELSTEINASVDELSTEINASIDELSAEVDKTSWIGSGNTSKDYTAIIQNKINELSSKGGGDMYFGSGTYPISKYITLPSNIRVFGNGKTVIQQVSEDTHAFVISGENIVMEDLTIKIEGGYNTYSACLYMNSDNANGDNGYPSNRNVRYVNMTRVRMVGTYSFSWSDGYAYLGDDYENYKGCGIMAKDLYNNYCHYEDCKCSNLFCAIYGTGGSNYYNITFEKSKYGVIDLEGGMNQIELFGHSYYDWASPTEKVSGSDAIAIISGEKQEIRTYIYDCQWFKKYIEFTGASKNNRYGILVMGGSDTSNILNPEDNDNESLSSYIADYGRGNEHISLFKTMPFHIGSRYRAVNSLTTLKITDAVTQNALAGAGIWGTISSNLEMLSSNGLELRDVCRYPKEYDFNYQERSVISPTLISEENPLEINIDFSNRPVVSFPNLFIQFDYRFIASDFKIEFYNGSQLIHTKNVINNMDICYYYLQHQMSLSNFTSVKITFTKALRIDNFEYENSSYDNFIMDYNKDEQIGFVNIGMVQEQYTGRAFLGAYGGEMYGNLNMKKNTISNIGDPVEIGDAVNKKYVDDEYDNFKNDLSQGKIVVSNADYANRASDATNAMNDWDGNDIQQTYAKIRPDVITDIPDTLSSNTSYNFGEVESLSTSFPTIATDGDVIYLTFMVKGEKTNITIYFTNASDIDIEIEPNTGYEIYAKYNGSVWIVGYSEYTVTDGESQ